MVLATLAVLVALLLPAVQAAREAARRGQCVNNLKQMGIALHSYHYTIGSFPPGHLGMRWNDWGPLVMLLPYVEQAPLYDSINFVDTGTAACPAVGPNVTAMTCSLAGYECPSDSDRLTGTVNFRGSPRRWGHNNYCGNAGNAPNSFFDNCGHDAANGVMFSVTAGAPTSVFDVLDGTGTTAAWCEKVKGIGGRTNAIRDPSRPTSTVLALTINKGATGLTFQDAIPNDYYHRCRALDPYRSALADRATAQGAFWWDGHPATGLYNHVMPPNTWSCNDGNVLDAGAATASSRHPGGVNVGMCDGSVRFIKRTINPTAWWALGTRNAGETISSKPF